MVLAATQPEAISTPVVGLAALVFHGTTNPAGAAMTDVFDFKALQTNTETRAFSIGGNSDDAATLAELLDSTGLSDDGFHINYEFDASAKVQVLSVFTDTNALTNHDTKPSVDQSGGVDCTGTTICNTDPQTRITTLTYPDGVVAIVERINDIAVVAYKTLGAAVLGHLDALPSGPLMPTAPVAAPTDSAPAPTADPAPAPAAPPVSLGAGNGPRLNVVRPAPDFTPGRSGAPTTSAGAKPGLPEAASKFVNDILTGVSDTMNRLLNRDGAPTGVGRPASPPPTGGE
jgi:hypothetical protein